MSQLDGVLHELARLRSPEEPIVSLYLDLRRRDERQRERLRVLVQDGARQALLRHPAGAPGRERLARTLERVREHVAALTERTAEPAGDGLALFACESLGLWRPMLYRPGFATRLGADRLPHLVQLVRLAAAHPPALVLAPDASGADVCQVALGELVHEERLRGEPEPAGAPERRTDRGEKEVRHAHEASRRSRQRAVALAVALFERAPGGCAVLVGTAENLATFERELPPLLRAAVIARVPRPREWEAGDGPRRGAVQAVAAAAVAEHQRRTAERRVEQLVRTAERGGLAALGPADVVAALNEGRVLRLVLGDGFARPGWCCAGCDAVGPGARAPSACPRCGGAAEPVESLGEALVARTLASGGAVDLVPAVEPLEEHLGVGAALRHQATMEAAAP